MCVYLFVCFCFVFFCCFFPRGDGINPVVLECCERANSTGDEWF